MYCVRNEYCPQQHSGHHNGSLSRYCRLVNKYVETVSSRLLERTRRCAWEEVLQVLIKADLAETLPRNILIRYRFCWGWANTGNWWICLRERSAATHSHEAAENSNYSCLLPLLGRRKHTDLQRVHRIAMFRRPNINGCRLEKGPDLKKTGVEIACFCFMVWALPVTAECDGTRRQAGLLLWYHPFPRN